VVIPFVEIHAEGDSFLMGDGAVGPGVVLSFSYDFSLSTYPITISQFRSFIEDGGYAMRACWTSNGWKWKGRTTSPAHWSDRRFAGQDQPVVGVSWYEAVAFCNWLSLKEGHQPPCDESGRVDLRASGYRLPTEAEWEYAAAKGAPAEAERIYPWGDVWDPAKVVCSVAPARADRPASVGSRSPLGDTPQGLADMCGNVWQWLSDCIQREEDIARGGFLDRSWFLDDSIGARMVLRGGSW
jgi:formylglycine-generating enzyme required for sulfatase activity